MADTQVPAPPFAVGFISGGVIAPAWQSWLLAVWNRLGGQTDKVEAAYATASAAAPATSEVVASGGLQRGGQIGGNVGVALYVAITDVASLPTLGVNDGDWAYALDAQKIGEAAGEGTGAPVWYSRGDWYDVDTGAASGIASLSTGLSSAGSGVASLSTSASSGISVNASGVGSLSTGLSSVGSRVASLSTSASSGISTAQSGVGSLSTGLSATNSAVSSLSSGVAARFFPLSSSAPVVAVNSMAGAPQYSFDGSASSAGVNIELKGNGSTTPNKFLRVIGGVFQIVNNDYSAVALSLTDAGALSLGGGVAAIGSVSASGAFVSTANPTVSWNLDTTGSTQASVAGGGTITLPAGAGTLTLTNDATGEVGLFLMGGGVVIVAAQTGSIFAAGAAASGKITVAYNGAGAYAITNGAAGDSARTIGIAAVRVRPTA
jgi:hypothetical protein